MTHPDSHEFLAILERVPRWHMLTRMDVIQLGDERAFCSDYGAYFDVDTRNVGNLVVEVDDEFIHPFRRRVPEHVRRSEAWWALYNQLATVAPSKDRWLYYLRSSHRHGILFVNEEVYGGGGGGFKSEKAALAAIPILGGEAEIIKNLQEGPGAYMRWVLNA